MRDDLLDAYSAIDWAAAELRFFAEKFHMWKNAETGIRYLEAEAGKKVAVFQKNSQLPSILNAGVGSIINSFRTALDLLATALARRNGVVHNRNIYFPIFRNESDFAEFLKKKSGYHKRSLPSLRDCALMTAVILSYGLSISSILSVNIEGSY